VVDTYGFSNIQDAPETSDGFRNLETSLPTTRRSRTNSHPAQCCLEFDMEMYLSVLINFSTLP
jgi:hypothetical protein